MNEGETVVPSLRERIENIDQEEILTLPSSLLSDSPATLDYTTEILNNDKMKRRAIVIGNLLSAEECWSLTQFMETSSAMTSANSKKEYRNCLRLFSASEKIADIIFKRIQPILSELQENTKRCDATNATEFLQDGLGMHGEWQADSVNSFFRLCKYHAGGHFGPHFDSDYIVDPLSHRSLKTLMIYLNDNYDGGETQFCDDHTLYFDPVKQLYCAPADSIHTSWKPRRGDCILFDHHLLHEGAVVVSGEKYIMRSEVMYKKISAEALETSVEEQAVRLWYEGCDLEAKGNISDAIRCYRRAYKLYPGLEQHFK